MLKSERYNFILQQLEKEGAVQVTNLAETLNVSPVTIRRDLAWMEKQGQLHRVYGGAVLREPFPKLVEEEPTTNLKRRIAEAANRFIEDNNVIFLGPGTLTQELVPFLRERSHLTIVTNALNIAYGMARQGQHTLHVIGGQAEQDFGIYGDPELFRQIRTDWVILEPDGLDVERGLTHDYRDYANMARGLLTLSAQVIVLIAPEQVGHTGALFIAPASEVDILITGREAQTAPLWDLSELGVRIVLT